MSTLYHAAPIILETGSIVLPGNWGRIVTTVGETHPRWLAEKTFEKIRTAKFPDLPSRLRACFACTSEAGLRFFIKTGFKGNPPLVLYEVETVSDRPQHLADYNLFQVNKPGETLEGNAERYWRGDFWYTIADGPAPGWRCEEIVTESPLRIIRRIA